MNTTAVLLQLTDGNRNSSCVLEKLSPEFMRVIQSSCRFIGFLEVLENDTLLHPGINRVSVIITK